MSIRVDVDPREDVLPLRKQAFFFFGMGVLLWWGSRQNYLLFHSVVEIGSVVVACLMGFLALSIPKGERNPLACGIGALYLVVAAVDVLHTLAYKGMGVFTGFSANLPTQLWILARILESAGLLAVILFHSRRLFFPAFSTVLLLFSIAGLAAVFSGRFPDCYLPETGLTFFKIFAEWGISAVLVLSAVIVFRSENPVLRPFRRALAASLFLTVASEMSFTLYTDVYGAMNMLGHLFKAASFYVLLVGVVRKSLENPLFTVYLPVLHGQQEFLKGLSGPSFLLDARGLVVLSNRDVPSGTPLEEALPEGLRRQAEEWLQEVKNGKDVLRREISFDGTDLLVTVRGLKDLEGKFSGAAFVSLDLTEQRKNTARVRFLSSIVENSLNEIYVLDPHMLRFEYANRGALEALGLRPGEILGRTLLDIAPNLTLEQLLERIDPICSGRQETVSFVEQHRKSDGGLYEVFLRLQGFGEGADRKIVAMGLDVSRRVRTLSTLRETNAMLAQLFENAPVGMFYCDKEGRVLKVNRAALRMFGYRKDEVLKKTVEEILVPEADREISLGHWKILFGEGRSILLEATRRKKDGSSLPIRVIGVPVFVKGEAKGAYLLYVDLTAEREARKATERLNRLLEAQVREERRVWEETIKVLARATELRDPYTAGHQRRVASLARAIAEEIGMEPEACHRVEMAATIHDVGKIEVPSEILVKPGALSPLERGLIQLHCEAGREILEDVVLSWPLAGDRLPAPRAPGRLGIPAGPERRRDSPRGPDYRGSRHCRGHGLAPALPSREGHRRSHGGNRAWAWSPIRSRRV